VGREFQLVLTVNPAHQRGVMDEFPGLNFVISHLGGGIAALLGRIEPYQDKPFWERQSIPGTVNCP